MTWIDRINRPLGVLVGYFYLLAVVVTAYEVVMRYVLIMPTTWGFELTTLLCASAYLLSGGYVTSQQNHIAITTIFEITPPAVQRGLRIFGNAVGVLAIGGLIWASWLAAWRALSIGERSGSAWNSLSPTVIKTLILLAAILVLLQLLANIRRELRHEPVP